MSIRVVVVDDQEMVRAGLRCPARGAARHRGGGHGSRRVRGSARWSAALAPDVVLMDVRMPVLDGIEATRQILRDGGAKAPRVVMLTTFDADDYVYESLRAGASGFLLKDASPDRARRRGPGGRAPATRCWLRR